jgi:putative ABC transport system permease protein
MSSSSSLGSSEPDYNIFVLTETFTGDIYTDIYITVTGAQELMCYDDAYKDRVNEVLAEVQRTGAEQSAARRSEVIDGKTIELTQALAGDETQLAAALQSLSKIENQWYYMDRTANSG